LTDADDVARRSSSQKLGDLGEVLVKAWVEEAGGWIARSQEKDYGIDLELELDEHGVRGELVKVQVRAHEQTETTGHVTASTGRKLLSYAEECRVPVVVVAVDLAKREAFYCWLQGWLLTAEGRRVRAEGIETHALKIPREKALRRGLAGELREIARHRTPDQLWLGMRDVLRSAIALRDERSSKTLAELLASARGYAQRPIAELLDEVLALGTGIWATVEGNRVSRMLYDLCRALGSEFSAEDVRRLVVRGDAYSRTGINALGILYDDHGGHVRTLGLPDAFRHDEPRIRYYCLLRERYLGRSSTALLNMDMDFDVGEMTVDPEAREELLLKWANRGDSAVLDYVVFRLPAEDTGSGPDSRRRQM
jgi:hypothetical protein